MLTDEAIINIAAGHGGPGKVSFLHMKYKEFGGPDGGDGGNGGNVVFRLKKNLRSLSYIKSKRNFKAQSGEPGGSRNCHGANGRDCLIEVPSGTVIKNALDDSVIADITEENPEAIIAHGGKGGKGNAQFVSSTNQAPKNAQPGTPGQEFEIKLELKLIADVGLVGFPNAGKSTLLSKLTRARPKIAGYPFTTLSPNLGVVHIDYHKTFVIADIPGLIEGAHQGVGLGIKFLKHIERTKILVFVIDMFDDDPAAQYLNLIRELELYNPQLLSKKRVIAANKMDLIPQEEHDEMLSKFKNSPSIQNILQEMKIQPTSGATLFGLEELKKQIFYMLES